MKKTHIFALCLALSAPNLQASQADFGLPSPSSMLTPPALQTALPSAPEPAAATIEPVAPIHFDYRRNLESDVFGAALFTGSFARQGAAQFNPDYLISVGDRVQVRFWGAFQFDQTLTVDPKGNVFLPHIGPVALTGVRNADLQKRIEQAAARTFRANVSTYASLAGAQPVRVFVSGFVNRPGLYAGTGMDSLLHYLDQAGGIDIDRGSFLEVQVKRGQTVRATVNLYEFLLNGVLPASPLTDGDVIFVAPRKQTVTVKGLAENARKFEFSSNTVALDDLVALAKPSAQATHVRVVRNGGGVRNVEYFPLQGAANLTISNGDEIEFTADKKLGTITVRIEGEHQSAQEYVLPHGARMTDLMKQITLSSDAQGQDIQLFRTSVKTRQKQMLEVALNNLESSALNARSGTHDEARLRKEEADLVLRWVERARRIEPVGQVHVARSESLDTLLLENGDLIKIPRKDGLVMIGGEVLFPNAVLFDANRSVEDYIAQAGGYAQNADVSRVVVARRDGSFEEVKQGGFLSMGSTVEVREGDQILVLPRIDVKSTQVAKDLTQILYQIAVSAKVVFGL